MSNIPDKDLTMEQSEKALNLRIDDFLEKFNPQEMEDVAFPVSYTHLTLPTILLV